MNPERAIELWGGVECTVNRVGETYIDQVLKSGHHDRKEDIARFAALGFHAMRYPVLWERVAPHGLATADWAWTDERLALLRAANIRPIATLLHHGSGPRTTHLLDPAFPEQCAAYAAAVAARYSWLQDYTPVNEPLTTARFSGLYGHWYPHQRDDRAFVTALLNEVCATVLAMARIREITPAARLIQTEDAGRTYSTPTLTKQAEFENHRRWLTFDFLIGRVSEAHPLWDWLIDCGASRAVLDWLLEHPCPPDTVGLNYYLTSDRYLDERLSRYPAACHGGNGRTRYADVEAVRTMNYEGARHDRILEEAWKRYGIPVALTEVHLGCTREDQLRWFVTAWRGASSARNRGVDVRAVTMWSLLGAFDWNSLAVRDDNVYEVGAFDVRCSPPRQTALATLARAVAAGDSVDALAAQPGWWERGCNVTLSGRATVGFPTKAGNAPILVTGGGGTLGTSLTRACEMRGLRAIALNRQPLDITSPEAIARALDRWSPWAVINTAGYVRVDDAELNHELCWRVNSLGAQLLAEATAVRGIRLVTVSTDLVFDGQKARPYVESDEANPLNVYGLSKRSAEESVQNTSADTLIARTAAFFGPSDQYSFLTLALREVSAGREVVAAEDIVVSPTYVPHLADTLLDLLIDGEHGIWHLTNRGELSWAEFAACAARVAGLDESLIKRVSAVALSLNARRPPFSALDSERGKVMPTLEAGIRDYLMAAGNLWRERRSRPRAARRSS